MVFKLLNLIFLKVSVQQTHIGFNNAFIYFFLQKSSATNNSLLCRPSSVGTASATETSLLWTGPASETSAEDPLRTRFETDLSRACSCRHRALSEPSSACLLFPSFWFAVSCCKNCRYLPVVKLQAICSQNVIKIY